MRVIDADVLFDVLHDRMKGAEEWITRAETDELKARAEGFLSALIEIKLSIEDEVTTIEAEQTANYCKKYEVFCAGANERGECDTTACWNNTARIVEQKWKMVEYTPVRHGRWEVRKIIEPQFVQNGYTLMYCSECGRNLKDAECFDYCPNCGAKMEGERDE